MCHILCWRLHTNTLAILNASLFTANGWRISLVRNAVWNSIWPLGRCLTVKHSRSLQVVSFCTIKFHRFPNSIIKFDGWNCTADGGSWIGTRFHALPNSKKGGNFVRYTFTFTTDKIPKCLQTYIELYLKL